jgi:hypothetical protein
VPEAPGPPASRCAARGPLLVLGLLCLAACQTKESKPPPKAEYAKLEVDPAPKPSYVVQPGAEAEPGAARVTEATAASGVRFVHTNGAFGQKWMPETMGSGVCFLDADRDGTQDLFLVDSTYFEGHRPEGAELPTSRLYRGLGGGRFEDVTARFGLERSIYGQGCAVADYDADGDLDLYVTALGDNVLWRNEGGRFTDATAEAGVAGGRWTDAAGREQPEWSTSAAFADLDGDGWLDLFVANYVRWTPETDVYSSLDGFRKAYSLPAVYAGQSCRYWRNRGDGRFEDRTREAGLGNEHGKSLGVAVADFDQDGLADLFVTNDTEPNFLYRNLGGGRFEDIGVAAGVAYDETGRARAGMGVDVAPIGPEGQLAVAIGNFSNEPISLYTQIQPGVFVDLAGKAQLSRPSLLVLTFGLLFCDLDQDGTGDLIVANGHLEPDIGLISRDVEFRQPLQVYLGEAGAGRFREAGAELGQDLTRPLVGRGLAAGDLDGDGDLDLVATENAGPAHLYRVDGPPASRRLRVTLRGRAPNLDALGAELRVGEGPRRQVRFVRSGSSYLSQSELAAVFSFGPQPPREVDVEVRWPGSREWTRYRGVPLGAEVRIDQLRGWERMALR